jgi:DNA polymerase/3'-5' exonuclease PolX
MKTKRAYTEMLAVAEDVKSKLQDACERIEIAGSIRRKQPMVGDIELVAIPKTMPDLFGTPMETTEVDILLFGSSFVNEIYKDGSRYKQFTMQAGEGNAYQVDLFLATPENWGYILMLRTGPSDFSRKMVTPIRHGGLLPPGLKVRDGYVWNGARIVCVQTEHALFAQWGMEYIAPEERR